MQPASTLIVVGGMDLGESDRIVRFLGAKDGRVSAVARRARASKKRFAGMLDLGARVSVVLRRGKGSLPSLDSVDLIRAPDLARRELERIALLSYGCEICAGLAAEDDGAPKLARLLEVWLDLLEEPMCPTLATCRALEAKALTFAGLAPTLDRCAGCGEALHGDLNFSHDAGGAVHPWCGTGKALDVETAMLLEAVRRTPMRDVVNNPGRAATVGAEWILSDFISWHLGRALLSRSLLQELLEPPPPRR